MKKKVVVVSGGSSGIGRSIIKRFSSENYLAVNLDIKAPDSLYQEEVFLFCDMRDSSKIDSVVKQIEISHGQIDVLVVNAGQYLSATIEETSETLFDNLMAINLKGAFFLTASTLSSMKKQQRGSIIFIGSDQCLIAKPKSALYGLTKAALGHLAKSTAVDYARFNIRANCLCVGTINTPLYQKAIQAYSEKTGIPLHEIESQEAKEQLLNRVGKPDEVADFVWFLAGDQSSFVTGAWLSLDGGYTTL